MVILGHAIHRLPDPEVGRSPGGTRRPGIPGHARIPGLPRSCAPALAHVRAGGAGRGQPRRGGLEPLPGAGRADLRICASGGHRQARARGARPHQSLLRRQSCLPRAVRQQLEPLLRHGARWPAPRRGRAVARLDRLPLQPAPRGAAVPGPRLSRHRHPRARARHGARRPFRRALGGLDGGDAARRARSAAPRARALRRCTWSASPTAARSR